MHYLELRRFSKFPCANRILAYTRYLCMHRCLVQHRESTLINPMLCNVNCKQWISSSCAHMSFQNIKVLWLSVYCTTDVRTSQDHTRIITIVEVCHIFHTMCMLCLCVSLHDFISFVTNCILCIVLFCRVPLTQRVPQEMFHLHSPALLCVPVMAR